MKSLLDKIYHKNIIDFNIKDIPSRPEPGKVLMVTPKYFDIIDVKNPYMEGQKGKVNKEKSLEQWNSLKSFYKDLIHKNILDDFLELEGVESCEDMVFAANQTFPWLTEEGEKVVIMSKMKHPSRQREVIYFEKYFSRIGYRIVHLQNTPLFEGMGDTIPHPGKRLLYGGYGHRSAMESYAEISELLQVPIIPLKLTSEKFYHLDTCFLPADGKSVFLHKEAFDSEGLDLIKKMFENIIDISSKEAENFALNAHLINRNDKKAALIQKNNPETISALKELGFEITEVDTSEYMKSGGSVFCMKMMVY